MCAFAINDTLSSAPWIGHCSHVKLFQKACLRSLYVVTESVCTKRIDSL